MAQKVTDNKLLKMPEKKNPSQGEGLITTN
jgi:hypothetical protein